MIIIGSIGVAFGPQPVFGVTASYILYAISRFIIACGTRGINVTGFVLGNLGVNLIYNNKQNRLIN
jgi:NhaP-type Na+/H+ and K+/H+ antiporter